MLVRLNFHHIFCSMGMLDSCCLAMMLKSVMIVILIPFAQGILHICYCKYLSVMYYICDWCMHLGTLHMAGERL